MVRLNDAKNRVNHISNKAFPQSSQYRIVPPALSTPTTSQTQATLSQTTELGVHDAMRYGLRTVRSEIMPTHPLENRLKNVRSILDAVFLGRLDIETTRRVWHPLESDFLQWSQTQENLKLQFARDVYGIHAPIRLQMEKHLVSQVGRVEEGGERKLRSRKNDAGAGSHVCRERLSARSCLRQTCQRTFSRGRMIRSSLRTSLEVRSCWNHSARDDRTDLSLSFQTRTLHPTEQTSMYRWRKDSSTSSENRIPRFAYINCQKLCFNQNIHTRTKTRFLFATSSHALYRLPREKAGSHHQ